ncbi:sulfotransferase family protein [Sinomicrobium oceani]|uniref:sulfotransferase family protein n=1 Tax=Sinomicrobium oceani TaxID=1150368 RepID=UPI00227C8425|nr:sulfotransferase family protein [Sinomicrobium oceani]
MKKYFNYIKRKVVDPVRVKNKTKIFCIGRNKTGTTSLKAAFEDLGFIVGNQRVAEKLLSEYKAGNFEAIIDYCKSAQVFQDFPFSYPKTYERLDKAYPGSKFILSVRDTPEQWYNSVTKFHAKRFGNGKIPVKQDLINAEYVWRGWMWECNRIMYKTPEDDLYNKDKLIKTYIDYNNSVKEYFRDRPEDLLIINLSEDNAYQKFCDFLGVESEKSDFPWENKTSSIKSK